MLRGIYFFQVLVDRRNEEEDEEENDFCEDIFKVLLLYMLSLDNFYICVIMEIVIVFVNRFDLDFDSELL